MLSVLNRFAENSFCFHFHTSFLSCVFDLVPDDKIFKLERKSCLELDRQEGKRENFPVATLQKETKKPAVPQTGFSRTLPLDRIKTG